jgi:hypothetical protein
MSVPHAGSGCSTMTISGQDSTPRMQPPKPGSEKTAHFTQGAFGCGANRIEPIHARRAGEDNGVCVRPITSLSGAGRFSECHDDRKGMKLKCGIGEDDLSPTRFSPIELPLCERTGQRLDRFSGSFLLVATFTPRLRKTVGSLTPASSMSLARSADGSGIVRQLV